MAVERDWLERIQVEFDTISLMNVAFFILISVLKHSVSDPDPGSVGSVIFSRIRIRLENNGSGSGSKNQICQKLFIFEQNFNKFKAENAKFLLNVQGFEYLRRFFIDKGNLPRWPFPDPDPL